MRWLVVLPLCAVLACGGEAAARSKVLFEQGLGRYLKKDLPGAEPLLVECLKNHKDHQDALLVLAKIYYFQNRDAEFEKTIERYLKAADGSIEGHRLQARWHLRKNEIVKTKEILQRILQRNGDDLISLYLLGLVYYIERDFTNALSCFKRATGSCVYLKNIHMKTSEIYDQLGLPERARIHREMSDNIDIWVKVEK